MLFQLPHPLPQTFFPQLFAHWHSHFNQVIRHYVRLPEGPMGQNSYLWDYDLIPLGQNPTQVDQCSSLSGPHLTLNSQFPAIPTSRLALGGVSTGHIQYCLERKRMESTGFFCLRDQVASWEKKVIRDRVTRHTCWDKTPQVITEGQKSMFSPLW